MVDYQCCASCLKNVINWATHHILQFVQTWLNKQQALILDLLAINSYLNPTDCMQHSRGPVLTL